MTSISSISNYSVTTPTSEQSGQVTIANSNVSVNGTTVSADSSSTAQSSTTVSISQQAIDLLQAETQAKSSADVLKLSSQILKDIPAELSEEQRLLLNDPLAMQINTVASGTRMLNAISTQIEQTYMSLREEIFRQNPDLKDAEFGFSLSAEGEILVSNPQGLSDEQILRLGRALNASRELVEQANTLADAQVALFNVEAASPDIVFNRGTYAQTIDIGAELLSRNTARTAPTDESGTDAHQQHWDNSWRQQVDQYGIRL